MSVPSNNEYERPGRFDRAQVPAAPSEEAHQLIRNFNSMVQARPKKEGTRHRQREELRGIATQIARELSGHRINLSPSSEADNMLVIPPEDSPDFEFALSRMRSLRQPIELDTSRYERYQKLQRAASSIGEQIIGNLVVIRGHRNVKAYVPEDAGGFSERELNARTQLQLRAEDVYISRFGEIILQGIGEQGFSTNSDEHPIARIPLDASLISNFRVINEEDLREVPIAV